MPLTCPSSVSLPLTSTVVGGMVAPSSISLAEELVALPPFCSTKTVMLVVPWPMITGNDANVGEAVGTLVGGRGDKEGVSVDKSLVSVSVEAEVERSVASSVADSEGAIVPFTLALEEGDMVGLPVSSKLKNVILSLGGISSVGTVANSVGAVVSSGSAISP